MEEEILLTSVIRWRCYYPYFYHKKIKFRDIKSLTVGHSPNKSLTQESSPHLIKFKPSLLAGLYNRKWMSERQTERWMDEMIQGKAVKRSLARENAKSDPELFF